MAFLKNLYTVAVGEVTKFQRNLDEKADEIRQEEEAKKRQQERLLEESRQKKIIEQERLHEQARQRELLERENEETIRNLKITIKRGELGRIKSALTCQKDVLRALSDGEYILFLSDSDDKTSLYDIAIQRFIMIADEAGEEKIKDYLKSL
jgi:hypothetical protein